MKTAVARFLRAAGLDPRSRALRSTPLHVARAWRDDFLDGYRADFAAILRSREPARSNHGAMVVIDRLDYVSICPHHLLPSRGLAHLAYLPGRWLVGLGQIARLLDACAHRLVLQEDLARDVARALVDQGGARGAACVLEARHDCLGLRGERRPEATTHTEAFEGAFATDRDLRRRFAARLARRT